MPFSCLKSRPKRLVFNNARLKWFSKQLLSQNITEGNSNSIQQTSAHKILYEIRHHTIFRETATRKPNDFVWFVSQLEVNQNENLWDFNSEATKKWPRKRSHYLVQPLMTSQPCFANNCANMQKKSRIYLKQGINVYLNTTFRFKYCQTWDL